MNLDDQICYCFHVPLRKLESFARRENLVRASQMSNCLGAGTGCGWCIPILKKVFERAQRDKLLLNGDHHAEQQSTIELPVSAEEYAAARSRYLKTDNKNQF